MIIDQKLKKLAEAGTPIRIGLVGSGFAARGLANLLLRGVPGMRLVGIANRTLENAEQVFLESGADAPVHATNMPEVQKSAKEGHVVLTTNPNFLTECDLIDVIVEATGEVEYGAQVSMSAIKNKKHLILINAELDSTLGPILKKYADEAGVVYTQADGDQPAVIMNLVREVELLGMKVVMGGNIKSLLDHYRTPETQKKWADEHFQRPKHVTSFADGTKISFEMATVANAMGFKVAARGMLGLPAKRVEEASEVFAEYLKTAKSGLVDYILGAEPSFGVFVLATTDDPVLKRYLQVYKMGDGPVYTFYRPYHLSSLEAPASIARAVLFADAALVPKDGLSCEVITLVKRNLKKGERLDGIGGFTCYGSLENIETAQEQNLLPMGLSDGATLVRDVLKDHAITYSDVSLPEGRLCDKLRLEQDKLFISGASLTVIIPTCYGGQSLLQTAKSLRASQGVGNFHLIVVADRTPITPQIKKELNGLGVELYWNDISGSQPKKVSQAIEITTSEFTVVTNDDITFEPWTLRELVSALERDKSLTMVGARILPLKPETLIESAIAALMRIMDRVAASWNEGENHLSASGRCLAYRTQHLKKFHVPRSVVNSDIYMYLRNMVLGGKFTRVPEARVFIRCPQKLQDHIGPSSRYQYLREEMNGYFKSELIPDYRLPKLLIFREAIAEFFRAPISTALYLGVFCYTRLKKQSLKRIINPVWEVDSSTKKI